MKTIDELLLIYINDPELDINNFNLARYYHTNGQTASAVSYYLRTAERSEDRELQYLSLLLTAKCFESQGMRNFTVKGLYQNAITICSNRPEAYYFLSKFYESQNKDGSWTDAYLTACIGVDNCKGKIYKDLYVDVDYPGYHGLLFQKAINGWVCGVCDESREILRSLIKYVNVDENFKDRCIQELNRISKNENDLKVEPIYHGDPRWKGFLFDNLIKELNYNSYLELGVKCANNSWKLIECQNKVGVDINDDVKYPGIINCATDEYFEKLDPSIKFDLIFINACKEKNFVYKDFCNSVKHLSYGGIIVIQDVFPFTEKLSDQNSINNAYEFWVELVNNYKKNTFTYIGHPGKKNGTVGIYVKTDCEFDPAKINLASYSHNYFMSNIGKYIYHKTITQNELIFNLKNGSI